MASSSPRTPRLKPGAGTLISHIARLCFWQQHQDSGLHRKVTPQLAAMSSSNETLLSSQPPVLAECNRTGSSQAALYMSAGRSHWLTPFCVL